MIGTFFAAWGGAFRDTARFAYALPGLLVLMAVAEIAQHGIEIHAGFFAADFATRQAASVDPVRMAFGWAKMVMVFALALFALRYGVSFNARETTQPNRIALRRYAGVALFQAGIAAIVIYAAPLLALVGIEKVHVMALRLIAGGFQQLAEPLLVLWYVNAAMGTRSYGPGTSARATGGMYPWVLLLIFAARVPFNALHQLLNRWPAGKGLGVLWPLLTLDAIVVSVMVVLIAMMQVRIARVLVARRGWGLLER